MFSKITKTTLCAVAVAAALATSAPAFAVAIDSSNDRPVTINATPAGEGTVQSILNTVFGTGTVNAVTGQSTSGAYASAAFPATTIPTLVVEYTGNAATNKFGIWFGSDTLNILTIDLLLGPASGSSQFPSAAGIQFATGAMQVTGANCGTDTNCGIFTDARITSSFFGFYLDVGGTKYFSADQLNGGTARMLAYENSTNWLFAFEDGTDFDFNDMAVKVESLKKVPEPGSLALLGLGLIGLGAARRRKA